MAKSLKCGSVVPGCPFVAHGDSDAEVMKKIIDHASSSHEVDHLSDDLRNKFRSNIEQQR